MGRCEKTPSLRESFVNAWSVEKAVIPAKAGMTAFDTPRNDGAFCIYFALYFATCSIFMLFCLLFFHLKNTRGVKRWRAVAEVVILANLNVSILTQRLMITLKIM